MLDAKTQLYRPQGKVEIPKRGLRRIIKPLKEQDFERFMDFITKKGYVLHLGDGTIQSVSYPLYALDGLTYSIPSGQVVSLGSLYSIPKGRRDGWICPIIKVSACNRGKINALERRVGIKKR
jgi:hypothetical protein